MHRMRQALYRWACERVENRCLLCLDIPRTEILSSRLGSCNRWLEGSEQTLCLGAPYTRNSRRQESSQSIFFDDAVDLLDVDLGAWSHVCPRSLVSTRRLFRNLSSTVRNKD